MANLVSLASNLLVTFTRFPKHPEHSSHIVPLYPIIIVNKQRTNIERALVYAFLQTWLRLSAGFEDHPRLSALWGTLRMCIKYRPRGESISRSAKVVASNLWFLWLFCVVFCLFYVQVFKHLYTLSMCLPKMKTLCNLQVIDRSHFRSATGWTPSSKIPFLAKGNLKGDRRFCSFILFCIFVYQKGLFGYPFLTQSHKNCNLAAGNWGFRRRE